MKNNKGFTFVEVMIIVAILGIILSVVIPQCIKPNKVYYPEAQSVYAKNDRASEFCIGGYEYYHINPISLAAQDFVVPKFNKETGLPSMCSSSKQYKEVL